MNIIDIKAIMTNRVNSLEQMLSNAYQSGDLAEYAKIELDLAETKNTLKGLE